MQDNILFPMKADKLWNMKFVDTVSTTNILWSCETIHATNKTLFIGQEHNFIQFLSRI